MAETQAGRPPWKFDPSKNVDSLVESAMRRQDDLREMESKHVRELMQRDREHSKELRLAESDRINAILAENAGNVARSAEVQAAQQQALATQVVQQATTVAETLRTTVAPMLIRLDELSRAQYETQGQKQQVVETRDIRGESRLNLGAIVAVATVFLTILGLILLYATKK